MRKLTYGEYIEKFGLRRDKNNSSSPLGIYKVPVSVISEWYELYVSDGIEPEDWSQVE